MALVQLVVAAVAYAFGGLFMKLSGGLHRPLPTAAFLFLFVFGACLQGIAMQNSDLGSSYIFVLGAEALITALLSVWYLNEHWSLVRVVAVLFVLAGILLLREN